METGKILLATHSGFVYFQPDLIKYVKAADYRSMLYMYNGDEFRIPKTLSQMEAALNYDFLVRCHRSWIVNLKIVYRIKGSFDKLILETGEIVPVSVRKKTSVRKKIEKM